MHLTRWTTALIATPLLVLLISFGGRFLFAVVISAVCIIALWEYFRIVFHEDHHSRVASQHSITLSFELSAFIIGPAIIWAAYMDSFRIILGLAILNFLFIALIASARFKSDPSVLNIFFKQMLGMIYIPIFLSHLILIRNGSNGATWIFFLIILVFLGDTGAYYVGSYLGRHKLCPAVSPNKTIEGSIGGLAVNLGAGAVFKSIFLPVLPWSLSVLFFLLIGVVGQAGDLFESMLKRVGSIKDSGTIFPGHGGILDRIDALLFAAPVAYFFKEYILMNV